MVAPTERRSQNYTAVASYEERMKADGYVKVRVTKWVKRRHAPACRRALMALAATYSSVGKDHG